MSNSRKKLDAGHQQGSLFDLLQQAAVTTSGPTAGSLNIHHRFIAALTRALKSCPNSRETVAGQMSDLLGVTITKAQLDAWTSEAKTGHRFPAEYLPAFCMATGDPEPTRILGEAGGLFVLPGPEALRAEIQRLDEQERRIKAEKRKRLMFLDKMEQS
jgi:hypothetical protein